MPITTSPVRVADVSLRTDDYRYRSPIKFGGVELDRVTLLTATVVVESPSGQRATGEAAMPLGNVWAFPSRQLLYESTLTAMRRVAESVARLYRESHHLGHPIDITHELEPAFWAAAEAVAADLALGESIPRLATLVAASPIDAALHDAFGKLHGVSVYRLYGRDALPGDLSRFLGERFHGRTLDEFVTPTPRESLPLYHLVGALDALTLGEVVTPTGDGLPDSLEAWIESDGLTHLKIKLDGANTDWDFARVAAVDRVAGHRVQHYSLDFNERCFSADALTAFLEDLRRELPEAFKRVQYVEQPLPRDLFAASAESVARAARLRPVVVDESLDGPESLIRAAELGYSGAAFKACKGQTQSLLMAALASEMQLFRCVQDLTCPGLSLIQSAGLAAYLPGVAAIEANARQYVPVGNAGWDARFPGLFTTTNGVLATGQLTRPGLGA